jgi:phosphomevalonate kinase
VSKTGLGSSSCAIVSVLSAVYAGLMHVSGVGVKADEIVQHRDVLYILSLLANNIAQNKIGSGFDISVAIYGS